MKNNKQNFRIYRWGRNSRLARRDTPPEKEGGDYMGNKYISFTNKYRVGQIIWLTNNIVLTNIWIFTKEI